MTPRPSSPASCNRPRYDGRGVGCSGLRREERLFGAVYRPGGYAEPVRGEARGGDEARTRRGQLEK